MGDRFVSEAALTTALRTNRLAVCDTGGEQRLIHTVHRRGCQFVAPATVAESSPAAGSGKAAGGDLAAAGGPAGADRQVIRFCRAEDGTCIAYAIAGAGPPLLKAANWMTHLDLEWTTPVWSHWPPVALRRHRHADAMAAGRILGRVSGDACGRARVPAGRRGEPGPWHICPRLHGPSYRMTGRANRTIPRPRPLSARQARLIRFPVPRLGLPRPVADQRPVRQAVDHLGQDGP